MRLDRDGRQAEVSIGLAPDVRGRGLGRRLVGEAVAAAPTVFVIDRLIARVKPENEPSLRAFRGAGFEDTGRGQNVVTLTLELPAGR